MDINRRQAILQFLFGTGMVGLRSLATGIPAAILLDPRKGLAADGGNASAPVAPQFFIYSTSRGGDPVNCNAPGTYDDPNIGHGTDPAMAATPITFGKQTVTGAQIWSTLPASVLARTCFFHHATYTVVHPDDLKVMNMMGAVASGEMLASVLGRELAGALGTIRAQPVSLNAVVAGGNATPLYFHGQPQPLLSPSTLASLLASPTNGLGTVNLEKIRDTGLDALNAYVRSQGGSTRQSFIDQYASSRAQLLKLRDGLLTSLSAIKDDGADSQIQAAIALFQMKVTPGAIVSVPFGADNHTDTNLAAETAQHKTGVASIAKMMAALTNANLQDQVTFAMVNVFGRTMMAATSANGRGHLDTHHVSVLIGPRIKGGVVGGLAQPNATTEYKALPIVSATGAGSPAGDVAYGDTFGAMGKTLATAVGLADSVVEANILTGKVIQPALNP